jgi:hypothetical protein
VIRFFHLATISALVTISAPVSLRAQDSGLLLGLHVDTSVRDNSYETYWIVRERGVIRMAAAGPDVLVPRKSGFWRVCMVSGNAVSEAGRAEWDSVLATPATRSRGRCAVTAQPAPDEERPTATCTTTLDAEILFVGADALSARHHDETNCGVHPSGGADVTLYSLDDLNERIDFVKSLEPARRTALLAASIKAAREAFADFGAVDSTDVAPDTVQGARLKVMNQWSIERGAGQWQIVGQVSCRPYVLCGDDQRTFSVDGFAAPRALTGYDELSPSLKTIKARFPTVIDAVSSPRGDLVVGLTNDSLLVFAPRDAELGAPVLRLPASGRIVMAQWAIGKFVPRWTEQLTPLLSQNRR